MTRGAAVGVVLGGIFLGLAASGCSDPGGRLNSTDANERFEAIRDLEQQGSEEAVARLAKAATHEDTGTAIEAIWALSRVNSKRAARDLSKVATSERRAQVRQVAMMALARRNEPVSRETAVRVLQSDSDPSVRGEAAAALGRVGTLDDVKLLAETAATDGSAVVEGRSVAAVERLLHVRFRYDPGASADERREVLERVRRLAPEIAEKCKQWRWVRSGR